MHLIFIYSLLVRYYILIFDIFFSAGKMVKEPLYCIDLLWENSFINSCYFLRSQLTLFWPIAWSCLPTWFSVGKWRSSMTNFLNNAVRGWCMQYATPFFMVALTYIYDTKPMPCISTLSKKTESREKLDLVSIGTTLLIWSLYRSKQ